MISVWPKCLVKFEKWFPFNKKYLVNFGKRFTLFKSVNHFPHMVNTVNPLLNDAVNLHTQAVDHRRNSATINRLLQARFSIGRNLTTSDHSSWIPAKLAEIWPEWSDPTIWLGSCQNGWDPTRTGRNLAVLAWSSTNGQILATFFFFFLFSLIFFLKN
jgi:hypothetical protein